MQKRESEAERIFCSEGNHRLTVDPVKWIAQEDGGGGKGKESQVP